MRTTLKRGVGRGAGLNGNNGNAVLPPAIPSRVSRYAVEPRKRSGVGLVGRILGGLLLTVLALGLGVGGGALLYLQHSFNAVKAHSADVLRAQKDLNVTAPGSAAIALLLGYDQRAGAGGGGPSRSDTVMLIRADPHTKTISLLSIPRDLGVPIYCPNMPVETDKINAAYADCGSQGTLETVKHLTGLPIQYLITVDFHGFKEIVNKIGGIWLNIDRRYYHINNGTAAEDYSNINIQPGYQLVTGGDALAFVRYRHTDDDYHRIARQQEFIKALKQQLSHVSILDYPSIISTITHNVEVGSNGSGALSAHEMLNWMVLALSLPAGHVFQDQIADVTGSSMTYTAPSNITNAVYEFTHPDVSEPKQANDATFGTKPKKANTPAPDKTTVLVLNGSGISGAAAEGAALLRDKGYVTVLPPGNAEPNDPQQNLFHTQIYYDPKVSGSKLAAKKLGKLILPSDVGPLPKSRALRALDPGAMVMIATGSSFPSTLEPTNQAATRSPPTSPPANVVENTTTGRELLEPYVHRAGFLLETPTVLDADSQPDDLNGDVASRLYWIDRKHHDKAVVLVFQDNVGLGDYWDIEETDMPNPPILGDRSFQHRIGGRTFYLYYSGSNLQMVVLRDGTRSYWVENTLLNNLTNKTMIAIARGLVPLRK